VQFRLSALILLFATPALAARPVDCAPITAAFLTTARTPGTIHSEGIGGHNPGALVFTGTRLYVQNHNGWTVSARTPAQREEEARQNLRGATLSCVRLTDERISGKPAFVYRIKIDNHGIPSDLVVWIGTQGLLLRLEDQSGNVPLVDNRYDYAAVRPPSLH
jgi:hypothetical protein